MKDARRPSPTRSGGRVWGEKGADVPWRGGQRQYRTEDGLHARHTQQIGPLDPLCALLMWTRKARTSTRQGRMVDHVLAAA